MTQLLLALTAMAIAAITAAGPSYTATSDEEGDWIVLSPTPLKKYQSHESGIEGMELEEDLFLPDRSKSKSPGASSSDSQSPSQSPPQIKKKRFTEQEIATWHQLVQEFEASQGRIAGILSQLEEITRPRQPKR